MKTIFYRIAVTFIALTGSLILMAQPPINISDSLALVELYNSTDGPNWTNNSGWLNGVVRSWFGINVDEPGGNPSRVSTISLPNNNLTGTIPAAIATLDYLFAFTVSGNHLTGTIPEELGQLPNLNSLNLAGNQLSGSIPASLGHLNHIKRIDLRSNLLTGSIPHDMGEATTLHYLQLDDNQLTGSIPDSLGWITDLQVLSLGFNQLSGTIPSELGQLSNLYQLQLSNNLLTGPIPGELGSLSKLMFLELDYNQLTGTIPSRLGDINSLYKLSLSHNQLVGPLPQSLCDSFPNLAFLDFEYNNLGQESCGVAGCLSGRGFFNFRPEPQNDGYYFRIHWDVATGANPPEAGNTKGDSIYLACSDITVRARSNPGWKFVNWTENGTEVSTDSVYTFPTFEFSRVVRLSANFAYDSLYADSLALVELYNSCNGPGWINKTNWLTTEPVSSWFGVMVNDNRVMGIELQNNNLTGSLPVALGQLTNLYYLYFSSNQLTGSIPPELGQLTKLRVLMLGGNQLSGSIPSALGQLVNLNHLRLGPNQFTGSIPPELGNLTSLQILELGLNKLTGSIPSELGQLTNLSLLELPLNQLTGSIPVELGQLTNLSGLNLVGNQLTGSIPAELGQLVNISYLDLSNNQLTGSIPPELGQLSKLSGLCLSTNQLTGSIPPELGSLTSLQLLYLNSNQLTGTIPNELGQLVNLTFLMLTHNLLTGSIPVSITQLVNLQYLSVYHNQLDNLPDLTVPANLNNFNVQYNKLTFEDLEYNMDIPQTVPNFYYLPQLKIGEPDTITLHYGDNYTLDVTCGGTQNSYEWFFNGVSMGNPPSVHSLVLESVDGSDTGTYFCRVTNNLVAGLTLESEAISIIVNPNAAPVANAGMDQSVDEGVLVTLDGSASSDPEGQPLTYHWTAPAGILLSDATASQPTFTAPEVMHDTTFIFTLVVNDGTMNSMPDTVLITVRNVAVPVHFVPVWTGNGFDQMNINIVSARLDGTDLEPGDEIGLFDGTLCVGSGVLTSTIDNTHLLYLKASRDDGTGNGFTPGHPIIYRFWDNGSGKEITGITAQYKSENPAWSVSGNYGIAATSFVELNGNSAISQVVDIKSGWNIISSSNTPSDSDMKALFQQLITEGKLIKVQDEKGNSLENLGSFGGWVNNIGNISPTEGYKVKVNGDCQLSITGLPVSKPYTIPLTIGWNIIGYPNLTAADAREVVQQLIDRHTLIKVMDEKGNSLEDFGSYGGWVNNIGSFTAGEGYKVKVSANETLTIFGSYTKSATIIPGSTDCTHFRSVATGNGLDHMNINLVAIPEGLLEEGDEIGVFDGSMCVGASVIGHWSLVIGHRDSAFGEREPQIRNPCPERSRRGTSEIRNISIPVSAKDGSGENGFTEGHPFSLKIWKAIVQGEFAIVPEILRGTPYFVKNESAIVRVISEPGTFLMDKKLAPLPDFVIFPNPTNGKINIHLNSGSFRGIYIFVTNTVGQQILNREMESNTEVIDLSDKVSGLYYFRITGDHFSGSQMIILKH